MTYCQTAPGHLWHGPYHDREYGFPTVGDEALFERLALEINQAGLSWLTVLKKRAAFNDAFRGFVPAVVAAFDDEDRARLLANPGIIRNRLKVDAVIENARRIVALQQEHGSFGAWLDAQHRLSREAPVQDRSGRQGWGRDDWTRLFRRQFKFMGGEIVGEFLMSTGYLPGAHSTDCPVYDRILAVGPPWTRQ